MIVDGDFDYLYEKILSLERGLFKAGLKKCDRCGEYERDIKLMFFKKHGGFIMLCLRCRHDAKRSGEV